MLSIMDDGGQTLVEARRRASLSQRALARRAGVPPSTVGRIERGEVSPTLATLGILLRHCGQRLDLGLHDGLLVRAIRQSHDIHRVCRAHGATKPRVFGSAANLTDGPGSDLDLLVTLDADADLLNLVALETELTTLLGVDVDVIPDLVVDDRLDLDAIVAL